MERTASSPVACSRRTLLAAAGTGTLAWLLASCGSDDDASGASEPPGTTSAPPSTSIGSTVASTASGAGGVVVLDEIAALGVLSLGIVPASVDLLFGYRSVADICEQLGVRVNEGERSVEDVLADRPGTVVGTSIPTFVEAVAQYEAVADTVVVDFALPWAQQLEAAGAALDRGAEAQALIASLTEAVEALAVEIEAAGEAGTSVSVLAGSADGPFALARTGLVGEVLAELGMARPAAQDVETEPTAPFVDIAPERLGDHDADVLVLMTGPGYPREPVEANPLWSGLGAVTDEAVHEVFAEIWFAASAFSLDWVLRDLRAILLDDGTVATGDETVERWQAFTEGT